MIRNKMFTAILLTGVLAFSAGCGSPKPNPAKETTTEKTSEAVNEVKPEEKTADGTKSINFWLDKGLDIDILNQLSEALYKDSSVDVKFENYPDTASFQTAMQQSIDKPDGPALFTWWSGGQLETLAKNGKIADLTAEWDSYIADGVSSDIKDAFTIDGKVYAAPYSVLLNVTLYNKDVFEKAGITELPKTFDEFLDACEKIKQIGVTPIGLKNDSWASFIWFEQMLGVYDPQLYKDICDGTKKYTDPEVVEVMELWKSMFDKGYFAKPVAYTDHFRAFAQGETAMVLEPSSTVATLVESYDMVSGEDVDALVVPSVNGEKGVIFFEASPICVAEANKDKEVAKEALRGFYKTGTQKVMVDRNGIVNTSTVELDDPTIKTSVDLVADSENYVSILRFYENTPEEVREAAINELSRFMYSGAPIKDVLDTIQITADKVFANN